MWKQHSMKQRKDHQFLHECKIYYNIYYIMLILFINIYYYYFHFQFFKDNTNKHIFCEKLKQQSSQIFKKILLLKKNKLI